MPHRIVAQSLLLPELRLLAQAYRSRHARWFVEKTSAMEVCPRCATPSRTGYDRRRVTVKDAPVRNRAVTLVISKRRFFCKPCARPFMEPVAGIHQGKRTTERYREQVLWSCENFTDLERVRKTLRCSSGFLYEALYERLELARRKRQYPWPKTLGIDEHSWKRNKRFGRTEFASVIVDYSNHRVMELVQGKTTAELSVALHHIEARHNVENVVVDLCDPFKNFAREFFPNARIVADKFHVLRLLTPAINRRRKQITGDRRSAAIRKLLLRNGYQLDYWTRGVIREWLEPYPELKEIYEYKEALHRLYRCRGYHRAASVLTRMTDAMASSQTPEITTLRRTLIKWRREILAYFETKLTNARTEGYNNLAKLIQRRAFGYRSFKNYRLRLLNACA